MMWMFIVLNDCGCLESSRHLFVECSLFQNILIFFIKGKEKYLEFSNGIVEFMISNDR